jgi:hypothetical protein
MKLIGLFLVIVIILACVYAVYKGNQPMSVPEAPKGMTYFEFMQDRIDAAKTIKPVRCGYGMFASLATFGVFYSGLYTYVAIEPDSFLAKVTAPDPDIAKDSEGARWYEVPNIWWRTVERLSWTMLGQSNIGCKFPPVQLPEARY